MMTSAAMTSTGSRRIKVRMVDMFSLPDGSGDSIARKWKNGKGVRGARKRFIVFSGSHCRFEEIECSVFTKDGGVCIMEDVEGEIQRCISL